MNRDAVAVLCFRLDRDAADDCGMWAIPTGNLKAAVCVYSPNECP